MSTLPKRAEIEEQHKWDLTQYCVSNEQWKKEYDEIAKQIPSLKKYSGKLTNKETILEYFNIVRDLDQKLSVLAVYASCHRDEDVTNPEYQKMLGLVENLYVEFSVITSFSQPQLSTLSDQTLTELKNEPSLKDYNRLIESIIRDKKHILSEQEELIMEGVGAFSGGFSQNFTNFENGDLKFKKVQDKDGNKRPMSIIHASDYLRDEDRVLRKNAYNELKGAYGRYNNFLYSNYLNNIKSTCFSAKTYHYDSALDQALKNEEVTKQVYDNLILSVNKHLQIDYDYFELKRKIMGLDKFAIYDIYYNPIPKPFKKISYNEAVDIVLSACQVLGEEYCDYLKTLLTSRCVDVLPNENKRSGAYSTGAYGKPPLVLLNYGNKYDDVSTLAHEMGHSMHTYLSNKNQPYTKAGYTIFLAEIASTVNECLLNRLMLSEAKTNQEKLYYINEFLSTFHATVFRQTMFAEYEQTMHNLYETNQALSAQDFNNIYYDLVKKYFGPQVECPESVKYEWSCIPHFYRDFYVYKYATGLISAIVIVNNIIKEGAGARDKYIKFLSSGNSSDPITLLKQAGVDLEDTKTFDLAFDYVKEYINLQNTILDKQKN